MIKKIQEHLKHNDFLEKEDISEIMTQFPLSSYSGDAYRVLLFSNKTLHIPDISQDMSFSKTIQGIKKYLAKQDFDYYPYCIVFKVNLKGIAINDLTKNYQKELGNLIDTRDEDEVCPCLIDQIDVFFNGSTLYFYENI